MDKYVRTTKCRLFVIGRARRRQKRIFARKEKSQQIIINLLLGSMYAGCRFERVEIESTELDSVGKF